MRTDAIVANRSICWWKSKKIMAHRKIIGLSVSIVIGCLRVVFASPEQLPIKRQKSKGAIIASIRTRLMICFATCVAISTAESVLQLWKSAELCIVQIHKLINHYFIHFWEEKIVSYVKSHFQRKWRKDSGRTRIFVGPVRSLYQKWNPFQKNPSPRLLKQKKIKRKTKETKI
jgi:hypothetical protein